MIVLIIFGFNEMTKKISNKSRPGHWGQQPSSCDLHGDLAKGFEEHRVHGPCQLLLCEELHSVKENIDISCIYSFLFLL